ncbi:MAG: glycosyltransferase family 4 protein [Elusimicrobiota bacterium]
MRILHIHDEIWDSGIAHYACSLAAGLRDKGHEIHFWAAKKSSAAARARAAGLSLREIDHPWISFFSLRRAIKSLRPEIINVHTGSCHSLAAALCAGRPWALVRTCADARLPKTSLRHRILAGRTHAFIAANTRISQQLKDHFPRTPTFLVFQGLTDDPQPLKLPPENPVVGILGRLDPVKGHDDFIDAAAIIARRFPQATFLIAGEGRPERLSKLRWQAEFLGMGKRLKFLERVPNAAQFMDDCSIGVIASKGSEAVSRAAIEWMSRGRPLVATRIGGLEDIVSHGETGLLITPRNSEMMAKAVEAIIEDKIFAAQAAQKARALFLERFSLKPFIAATEHVYEQALHPLSY